MTPPRPHAGQASVEYVAALAVVVVLVTTAAVTIAAPEIPAAVMRHIKTALCIVGGDVCSSADARAAGLEPCPVVTEGKRYQWSAGFGLGGTHGHSFRLERRSDGTVYVEAGEDRDFGLDADTSVRVGPWVSLSASGKASLAWLDGHAWELPGMAAARRLLARVPDGYHLSDDGDRTFYRVPRPPISYNSSGRAIEAAVSAELGSDRAGTALDVASLRLRHVMGLRTAPEARTLYVHLDATASGPLVGALPQLGRGGEWIAEWRLTTPRVMTLRRVAPGDRDGEIVETVARAALTDPADVAVAKRFLLAQAEPALAVLQARRLAAVVRARGAVERLTYREQRSETGGGARILGIGLQHDKERFVRRLVDAAVVSGPGLAGARRLDCTGA